MLKTLIFVLSFVLAIPNVVYCNTIDDDVSCSAKSAIVMDYDTKEILYQKNKDLKCSIASTTKILTAIIAIESGKLNDKVTIDSKMIDTVGTSLGLKIGDKITLYDLVVGMLIVSGNDAANAIAYYLSSSIENFASLMNKKAKEIGMNNSYFVTPSGLDEGNHHSTAYDMAILAIYALSNDTFSSICKLKSCEITVNAEKRMIYNHNKLLSFLDDCIGLKTGFTKKAGRCLVSAIKRNNHTLVCVTLNDANDWDDHINLYEKCMAKYKDILIDEKVNINVVGANENNLVASYKANLSVIDDKLINVLIYHFPFLYAPIKIGDVVGKVEFYYKERKICSVNLVAEQNINYNGK